MNGTVHRRWTGKSQPTAPRTYCPVPCPILQRPHPCPPPHPLPHGRFHRCAGTSLLIEDNYNKLLSDKVEAAPAAASAKPAPQCHMSQITQCNQLLLLFMAELEKQVV